MIKFRRLDQCDIPTHCCEFVISVYSAFEISFYYKRYFPLFTIIMNNLILYQKFLNERRRTISIFAAVCVFLFCSIAFYLVSIILFENFAIHFHLKSISDMLEDYWLTFLVQTSPKKKQNYFPDQLGLLQITQALSLTPSPNIFHSFPFLSAMIPCSNLTSHFL